MELLIQLFLVALLTLSITVSVMAFVAWKRSQQIAGLSKSVDWLRSEVRRLRGEVEGEVTRSRTPTRSTDDPMAPEAPEPSAPAAPLERPPVVRLGVRERLTALKRTRPDATPETQGHQSPPVVASTARKAIDWEWLLGVRGAAILGGVVLALACVLFFRHAFVNNWISPPLRLAMGATFGLCLIGAGARLRKSAFRWVPAALQGAGLVGLYATIYAADQHYGYLNWATAFPLMALVTAASVWLALANDSVFIAQLGLLGGFTTPVFLYDGGDRPLSTASYLILLNFLLLVAGRRKGWGSLMPVALVATFGLESLWIGRELGPGQGWTGLLIVGALSLFFLVAAVTAPRKNPWVAKVFEAGTALSPFFFALFFANSIDFDGHIWPTALLLGLASLGGWIVGVSRGFRELAVGAALAPIGILSMWLMNTDLGADAVAWEFTLVTVVLGGLLHLCGEVGLGGRLERLLARVKLTVTQPVTPTTLVWPAVAGSLGWLVALIAAFSFQVRGSDPSLVPRLLGLLFFCGLLLRQAHLLGSAWLVPASSLGLSLGLAGVHLFGWQPAPGASREAWGLLGLGLLFAGVYLAAGWRVQARFRRWYLSGASLFLAVQAAFLPLVVGHLSHPASGGRIWFLLVALLAFGLMHLVATSLLRSGWAYCLGVPMALWMAVAWQTILGDYMPRENWTWILVLHLLAAALFTWWPLLRRKDFATLPWVWRLAALVPLLWLPLVGRAVEWITDSQPTLIACGLQSVLVGALLLVRPRPADGAEMASAQKTGLAWAAGVLSILVALGLSEHIGHNEGQLLPALFGLGVAFAGFRLRHAGLAWWGAAAALMALAIGLGVGLDRTSFRATERPLVHWLTYAYLVPAAAAGLAYTFAKRFPLTERPRANRWIPGILGAACAVQLFLWMNLEIANHFATGNFVGPFVNFAADRLPAANVSSSVAWGLFALGLLGLGSFGSGDTSQRSGPRWASLGLFALAIGKVFLFDLRHLEGLWRVASLVGLAAALILLSLLYQRFVFKKEPRDEAGAAL